MLQVKLTSVSTQGVPQLALCLSEESEQHIKAAAVWSIGQIGQHSSEHAKAVATVNLLPKLLELYTDASSSEDLQAKVRRESVSRCLSHQEEVNRSVHALTLRVCCVSE